MNKIRNRCDVGMEQVTDIIPESGRSGNGRFSAIGRVVMSGRSHWIYIPFPQLRRRCSTCTRAWNGAVDNLWSKRETDVCVAKQPTPHGCCHNIPGVVFVPYTLLHLIYICLCEGVGGSFYYAPPHRSCFFTRPGTEEQSRPRTPPSVIFL